MAKVLTAIVHFSPTQVKQILAKVEEQENQNVSYFFLKTILKLEKLEKIRSLQI